MTISDTLRRQVIQESNHRCEYCKTPSRVIGMPLVIEHILPKVLGGQDDHENLAASCYGIRSIVFTPDGSQVISGSFDQSVKLWDVETGECLRSIRSATSLGRMNITGVKGLTDTEIAALKALGAIAFNKSESPADEL